MFTSFFFGSTMPFKKEKLGGVRLAHRWVIAFGIYWWTMLTRVNFKTYDDTRKEGGGDLVFVCSPEMIFN